ncbi:SICA C-terminal inner membrane domain containing protein, putative [Plasmodium ovale]|uniref:SICA C-terminal inner membrane domain containing protein, putative n=1 Tax=Plasmodium ovale TaxID=36330 RepID=A0A1C3KGV1_PLAOA|nr:SICA C-terminal inner membrane domain containing protein, putative [Plasmodium ovale]
MQEGDKYSCDDIKKASKLVTNNIFLPYKTPILLGAIKIINDYSKDNNDGIHYKNLCEELHKYVKSQKKCIDPKLKTRNRELFKSEWKIILSGLRTTFDTNNVKKICYWEGDNSERKKRNVLDVHEAFRNFCIEKRRRLEKSNTMHFQECNDYLSWLDEKKRELRMLDPNYDYIRQFAEYFYIHHNCNYPWLIQNKYDITCHMLTRTRAAEKDRKEKTLGEDRQPIAATAKHIPEVKKKDAPLEEKTSSQRDVNPGSDQSSKSGQEQAPTQSTSSHDGSSGKNNIAPKIPDVEIMGTDISKSPSNSYTIRNYTNIKQFPGFFTGKKIPHVARIPIHKQLDISIVGNHKPDIVKIQPATPDPSLFRSPFMIYTLIFLILFTITATLYLLSKYTSLGLFFSNRKNIKRLKRKLEFNKIVDESLHFGGINIYSINNIPRENETNEDSIYKQIKIKKSTIKKKKNLPKRKRNIGTTIIDIHMDLLDECKNNEWEMNKNDFLEICLEEFIREQNRIYANSENIDLTMKTISIQNTKAEKSFLWDKWTERYKPIWEKLKRESAFKDLQNVWKEEEKKYLDKINQSENNILNENQKIPLIERKKDLWKKWIAKQATLIELYKEEHWIKSLVKELENVSDTYNKEETRDDIFVVHVEELEHKKSKEKIHKRDNHIFLIKVLIQVLMMVIEECIKQENTEKKELVLDTFIGELKKTKSEMLKSENIENAKNVEHTENIFEDNENYEEFQNILEQEKYEDAEIFNELIEGWTSKDSTYINPTYNKIKNRECIEMPMNNF